MSGEDQESKYLFSNIKQTFTTSCTKVKQTKSNKTCDCSEARPIKLLVVMRGATIILNEEIKSSNTEPVRMEEAEEI